MDYNLVIDQGNSRAKVAIFNEVSLVEAWQFESLTPQLLLDTVADFNIRAAIYCSVALQGQEIVVTLRDIATNVYELTSLLPLPVTVGYATPSTLGRDRVAAVVGALSLFPGTEVLVVDAGTAITYDRLTAARNFIGGNIAPGLWMRASALHTMTSRLPEVDVESPGEVEEWGTSTEGAIRAGVVRGVAGEITHYRSLLPEGAQTILTGGDAPFISQFINPLNLTVEPLLVCKGLNSILLYNESR